MILYSIYNYGNDNDNDGKRQSCHDIETSQLICRVNQLTDFYMTLTATLAFNVLMKPKFAFYPPFVVNDHYFKLSQK